MKRILAYLRPYYGKMILGFVIKFIGTIMDLALPWILAHIIDEVIPLKNIGLIFYWGLLMLVCCFVAVWGNIRANRNASAVAQNAVRDIRHDAFEKVMSLSPRQVDQLTIPSIISRLTSDTYNVHQMIGMMQRLGVRAPLLFIGGICVTLTLDAKLTCVLLATVPFIVILVYLTSHFGIPKYRKLQERIDDMVRVVRENITGVRVIKALSMSEHENERFHEVNRKVVAQEKDASLTMALNSPFMNIFLNLGLVAVIIVGAYRVNGGLSEAGTIVAFLSYFTIILNAMLMITRIFIIMSKASASANRIAEILEMEQDLVIDEDTNIYNDDHIVFDHVYFSYENKENNLSDISFSLNHNDSLGIIGATGSGKSTLVNLLLRFYDVNEGTITIDGKNIKSYELQELRSKFGVVFQNDSIFTDTMRANIDFYRELSDDHLKEAIRNAQALSVVESKNDGINEAISAKGNNLSGGQKQRVLIARALAGCPEILILDDSSSALDYRTDAELRKAIQDLDMTSIIIAQRVSSVRNCSQILLIDEGHIVAKGTHEKLMESSPLYREIAESQMGGDFDA